MGLRSNLNAQLGFKEETVYGTAVTVDTFVPLVDESITYEIARLESEGIIAGRRILDTDQWKPGGKTIGGDIGLEVYEQSIGTLLKHALGVVSTTGAGPYAHTLTPGDLSGKGLTMQVGRQQTSTNDAQAFTYAGCKIGSWEIAATANEIATLGLSIMGTVAETTGIALASVSYADQATRPLTAGAEATVMQVAAADLNVKTVNFTGDNGLSYDERRFLGSDLPSEPLEQERREYAGSITAEFESLTQYNRFVNGTEADITTTLSNGTESLAITAHARFDGSTPVVGGRGIGEIEVPFKLIGDGSDADALSIVYTCDDATV